MVARSTPSVHSSRFALNTILLMKGIRTPWRSGCFQGWERENMRLEHLVASENKDVLKKNGGVLRRHGRQPERGPMAKAGTVWAAELIMIVLDHNPQNRKINR